MEFPTTVDSSSQPPPWVELPGELTANILRRLGVVQILESAEKVCTTWRKVCQDPALWRVIHMENSGAMRQQFTIMCRIAVDRSQGQLIGLTLDGFGDDELLKYVVDRSTNLRYLNLDCFFGMTGIGLSKAVKKLEHLKELHLSDLRWITAEDVETIGIACPMLRSFACKLDCEYRSNNDFAGAIATTMPNLFHLELGCGITNEGLEAILDGCPHLESLDLRLCNELDLRGDLGKRCSEQIKDLKGPLSMTCEVNSDDWLFDDERSSIDFECDDDYPSPFSIEYYLDGGSWSLDGEDFI